MLWQKKIEANKKEWVDVTDYFSMERRCYKDTFLEVCEVYDNILEVSLFTRDDPEKWEVYVGYSYLTGIIRTTADKQEALREEIKKLLVKEYKKNKKPTEEFMNEFEKKYKYELEDVIG